MKFQLRIMFSILMFIFRLSAEDNEQEDDKEEESNRYEHQRLYKMVVRRPTASEITSAISDLKFYQDIQVERLQVFFSSGPYSADFIELLNTYRTLSYKPIKFSADEITTLTTVSDDRGSLNNKILTQIKFYRKIQEIQCTNYAILKAILPSVKDDFDGIANYVYCMIDMSYRGRFVMIDVLWALHIQLLIEQQSVWDSVKFLSESLPFFDKKLQKLLTACRENEYLMKNYDFLLNYYIGDHSDVHSIPHKSRDQLSQIFLKMYDLKYQIFVANNYFRMPLSVNYLVLDDTWGLARNLLQVIPGLSFDWTNTYLVFEKETNIIEHQFNSGDGIVQSSNPMNNQEILLDIIKAKWYIYVWIHLVVYRNAGSKAQRDYDRLIVAINKRINFVYTDDRIFNDVLILLSEIYKPEDEKINETIQILSDEVNRILRSVTEPSYKYIEATIDNEFVERTTKEYEDSAFINTHVNSFEDFIDDTEDRMNGKNLRLLLLYINGNKLNDFFFPNEF